MIVPTENTFILHIPDELIGKNVEVIAFSTDDTDENNMPPSKKTIEDAIAFYTKNAIDFTNIEKWNREDLYE